MLRPALMVHGGAGAATSELQDERRAGCAAALAVGWAVLERGGKALDAACEAVAALEADPVFNAGVGSCLTSRGTVEMDASVMDGTGLRAGAVALVRTVRHPIHLARVLLEEGRHVMLAGHDADALASSRGLPTCAATELITARQHQRWREQYDADGEARGTVGAVAVDRRGHVAAATSTGGIFCKMPGRIGDSAVIGAGTYADSTRGAASATGNGEAIMRVGLAAYVVDALQDGRDPQNAASAGMRRLAQRTGGTGGIIVVDPLGRFGHAHNTPHMTVGYMRADLPVPIVHA